MRNNMHYEGILFNRRNRFRLNESWGHKGEETKYTGVLYNLADARRMIPGDTPKYGIEMFDELWTTFIYLDQMEQERIQEEKERKEAIRKKKEEMAKKNKEYPYYEYEVYKVQSMKVHGEDRGKMLYKSEHFISEEYDDMYEEAEQKAQQYADDNNCATMFATYYFEDDTLYGFEEKEEVHIYPSKWSQKKIENFKNKMGIY